MQVWSQPSLAFSEGIEKRVVNFSSLYRRESEAYIGYAVGQGTDKATQRAGTREIPAVAPYVHSHENDFSMRLSQQRRLLDHGLDGFRSARPPCNRGCAERTVLVASILNAEPSAGAAGKRAEQGRCRITVQVERSQHRSRVGIWNHLDHIGQRGYRPIVHRSGAPHDNRSDSGPFSRNAAYEPAHLRFTVLRNRTRVYYRSVSLFGILDDGYSGIGKGLADQFGIVLIGLASEGMN